MISYHGLDGFPPGGMFSYRVVGNQTTLVGFLTGRLDFIPDPLVGLDVAVQYHPDYLSTATQYLPLPLPILTNTYCKRAATTNTTPTASPPLPNPPITTNTTYCNRAATTNHRCIKPQFSVLRGELCEFLAPQSGALRISAYRDFHPTHPIQPIPSTYRFLSI